MALDPKGGFDQIMSMARGFQVAKMLMVAVDLGLFDFLEEPKSAVETAAWLKADPRATGIFLNGLAALGLVARGIISRTASWPPATWCGARKTTGGPSSSTWSTPGNGAGKT